VDTRVSRLVTGLSRNVLRAQRAKKSQAILEQVRVADVGHHVRVRLLESRTPCGLRGPGWRPGPRRERGYSRHGVARCVHRSLVDAPEAVGPRPPLGVGPASVRKQVTRAQTGHMKMVKSSLTSIVLLVILLRGSRSRELVSDRCHHVRLQ